jgi:hypothetical protein
MVENVCSATLLPYDSDSRSPRAGRGAGGEDTPNVKVNSMSMWDGRAGYVGVEGRAYLKDRACVAMRSKKTSYGGQIAEKKCGRTLLSAACMASSACIASLQRGHGCVRNMVWIYREDGLTLYKNLSVLSLPTSQPAFAL